MTQEDPPNDFDRKGSSSGSEPLLSAETIAAAIKVVGLDITAAEIELMVKGVNEWRMAYEEMRAVSLGNEVSPALSFRVLPPAQERMTRVATAPIEPATTAALDLPSDPKSLAFAPVAHLAQLIRTGQVSSLALTRMALDRLKRYGPRLACIVTLTDELALSQAQQADEEIAKGHYRGPLHGIPWGAKDLLATPNLPTTWGAMPYKDQVIDDEATVVTRLREAGAVLVAKLSLGALAWGDVWFGGKTRNPWNLEQGSRGSSAGSAAAVAAGLVPFAIGTETYGSIISPCARCGVTGLRPTFGRVSRHGAMALSWSADKIGPICRTVEDCALVFSVIHGADGRDSTAVTRPFDWQPEVNLADLRIGYLKSAFAEDRDNKHHDDETLRVLKALGADLVRIELPSYPVEPLNLIIMAEAAAAFDELTRSNRDDLLVRQSDDAWPNVFRGARLIPAVEYIQANRIRALIMKEMSALMREVDLYLAPSLGGNNLLLTNLTGHPAVVVPNGLSEQGVPESSITFIGQLFDEATIMAVAKAYQESTGFHLQHPPLDW